ncbi:hypothetical protein [Dermatobacter hominis]|uniref:hypothetical protein n=1 Tax=Dermatobacter hominis TaxID=2884263 RepID=UPI001D1105B2|nr:hypothetical protein [Dermatobacter hominis]UDY36292.1 hypothetical protein LH044_01865 [Dermatobacter hominis]
MIVTAVACSDDAQNILADSPEPTEVETTATTTTSIPDYPQNPGDILSLSNTGVVDYIYYYDDYTQLRDYSDTVVLATLAGHHRLAAPTPDGLLPGHLQLDFAVDEVIGGLSAPPSDTVAVVVQLDGTPSTQDRVYERLTAMEGEAQYLLFLDRATPVDDNADLYVAKFNGPEGILAIWPGDGRLSPINPSDDLFEAAKRRGEQLTGTTSPPFDPRVPRFIGEPPIGMTVDQLLTKFARPVGTTEKPPPLGWERYKQLQTEARDQGFTTGP